MSIIQIIFSHDLIIAYLVYLVSILVLLPLFAWIHNRLNHVSLQWSWEHVGMPLLRAALMVVFIFIAYPLIFGIRDAPSLAMLLAEDEMRIHYLINVIFVITLLFPVIPVLGRWNEFILPSQGMAASMFLFSWMTGALGIKNVSYWPGFDILACILVIAIITHYLAIYISRHLGYFLDKQFNVLNSGKILYMGIILFMQSPSILVFSLALGRQLG